MSVQDGLRYSRPSVRTRYSLSSDVCAVEARIFCPREKAVPGMTHLVEESDKVVVRKQRRLLTCCFGLRTNAFSLLAAGQQICDETSPHKVGHHGRGRVLTRAICAFIAGNEAYIVVFFRCYSRELQDDCSGAALTPYCGMAVLDRAVPRAGQTCV